MKDFSMTELAGFIDHTNLKADATKDDIKKLCDEAIKYRFASVCVYPCYIELVSSILKGSGVKAGTVAGFPIGANTKESKAFEARDALKRGAEELDMVLNIGALKSGDIETVIDDIKGVVQAAGEYGAVVKVILETCYLTDEEKVMACRIVKEAGADFVKTSTGLGPGGATAEDVRLMRKTVGPEFGVKAAGGIRSYEDAVKMIQAGANRLGTSSAVKIMEEMRKEGSGYVF
jgi:deoxyribose-phosphate aldolase